MMQSTPTQSISTSIELPETLYTSIVNYVSTHHGVDFDKAIEQAIEQGLRINQQSAHLETILLRAEILESLLPIVENFLSTFSGRGEPLETLRSEVNIANKRMIEQSIELFLRGAQ